MIETTFVDTNVLVYARDRAFPKRQKRAAQWLAHLWENGTGRLSTQVLSEFYVTVTRKLTPGLPPAGARREVRTFFAWKPVPLSEKVLDGAWTLQERLPLAWWDALIVSAAQVCGARYLLTEDLQDGQNLDGIEVVNPFEHAPR